MLSIHHAMPRCYFTSRAATGPSRVASSRRVRTEGVSNKTDRQTNDWAGDAVKCRSTHVSFYLLLSPSPPRRTSANGWPAVDLQTHQIIL